MRCAQCGVVIVQDSKGQWVNEVTLTYRCLGRTGVVHKPVKEAVNESAPAVQPS